MIKRTYFAICDNCGTVLKDNIFNTYYYDSNMARIEQVLLDRGWYTEDIPDSVYKRDLCPSCNNRE